MTQDVVTARDAAALADVTLRFQDAQLICQKVDLALKDEGYRPSGYSEPVLKLFQLAWAVASHKHSRQVTVYHLAYALACNHPEAGRDLAEWLEGDVGSFTVGCFLKLLSLGLVQRDEGIVEPAVDAVRWLGAAFALAKKSELRPEHLVQVIKDDTVPRSVRTPLRAAARLGVFRRDAVLGREVASIASRCPSFSPRYHQAYAGDREGRRADSGLTIDITNLIKLFDDFEDRYSADVDEHKRALARNRGVDRPAATEHAIRRTTGCGNHRSADTGGRHRPGIDALAAGMDRRAACLGQRKVGRDSAHSCERDRGPASRGRTNAARSAAFVLFGTASPVVPL